MAPGAYAQPGQGYGLPPRLVPAAPNGQPLASFGDRLLAYLLDILILALATTVLTIPAVIAMFVIISDAARRVETDPVTGEILSEPDPFSVMLPIVGIFLALLVLSLAISYVYYVEMMYKRASTVGKRVMKLRIIRLDDSREPLTRGIAVRRWVVGHLVGGFVPFFSYLDGFWQLWDKPFQQCLHDKWANTVVVKVDA